MLNNKSIIFLLSLIFLSCGSNKLSYQKKKVRNIKVLYGGSVNPKNINELKLIKNIDGFLIGGASQDAKKFIDIIKKTYN